MLSYHICCQWTLQGRWDSACAARPTASTLQQRHWLWVSASCTLTPQKTLWHAEILPIVLLPNVLMAISSWVGWLNEDLILAGFWSTHIPQCWSGKGIREWASQCVSQLHWNSCKQYLPTCTTAIILQLEFLVLGVCSNVDSEFCNS